MNYYFSGMGLSPVHDIEYCQKLAKKIPFRLLSCYTDYTKFAHFWANLVTEQTESKTFNTLLLDSGAFTAWNKGVEMQLKDLLPTYAEFMNKYHSECKEIFLINLDKIPGSPGLNPTDEEVEECVRISDENYNILVKEFGNRVIPVFHQGEGEQRLQEIVEMAEYICVSPRNDIPEKYRVQWSQEVHSKIPASTKTHGLATTGLKIMKTVPWYSVDSASWMFTASTGSVSVIINGKLVNIGISEKSSNRFQKGTHYDNILTGVQAMIDLRMENNGYTLEELQTNDGARCAFTMEEIQHWVDSFHTSQIAVPQTLFGL